MVVSTHGGSFAAFADRHRGLSAPRILACGALLSATLFLACSSRPAWAQNGIDEVHIQPRLQEPEVKPAFPVASSGSKPMKVFVDLVLVPVTILDGMNRLVKGLGRDNFQVFEGKHQQDIRYFSSEDAPVSLGIILDLSGSMKSKIDRAREGVVDFLNTANPEDEFFMITFADKPEQVSDFTEQVEDIQGRLLYAVPNGRTSLLDAIYLGINKMAQAKHQRKALLIISDGGDNHSRYTESEIKSVVKEADVMIYAIGLYDHSFPTMEEFLGPEMLRNISEVTGGTAFTIDNPNDLSYAAKSIGVMLRNQYLLGYRPAATTRDGKWHKIKIKLAKSTKVKLPSLRVLAKTGYYAPAD
jgi:Ca-activated chloride channel family protein